MWIRYEKFPCLATAAVANKLLQIFHERDYYMDSADNWS